MKWHWYVTAYQEGCFKWGLKQTSVLVVGIHEVLNFWIRLRARCIKVRMI